MLRLCLSVNFTLSCYVQCPGWESQYKWWSWVLIWVTLSESFRTSIRGFSGSNHEDIFWNFPNWSTSNLRNWVSIYRQLQADCLYHINCLYNFPAYTWRQKRNAFPGLCSGSIFMIQKNLIIILGTEPRILCSEVIRKNNSSMTQLIVHIPLFFFLNYDWLEHHKNDIVTFCWDQSINNYCDLQSYFIISFQM